MIHHQKTLSNGKPGNRRRPCSARCWPKRCGYHQDELGEHRFSSGRFDDAARLMEQIAVFRSTNRLPDPAGLPLPGVIHHITIWSVSA
ncbi:hypothetical protein ACNKHS_24100 [Shigella flexneri]